MTSMSIATAAADLTVILMALAFTLAFAVHVMRPELNAIERPFSAYLSGTSRRVALACYGCLVAGISAFAVASTFRPGLAGWSAFVPPLYLISVVFVAIAAMTARSDAPLVDIDNPRTRRWHRQSAFLAFSSAIMAISVHTWLWREQEFLKRDWPQLAMLTKILVALYVVLLFVTARFKGAVQKLLIVGIVVWIASVALMMRS